MFDDGCCDDDDQCRYSSTDGVYCENIRAAWHSAGCCGNETCTITVDLATPSQCQPETLPLTDARNASEPIATVLVTDVHPLVEEVLLIDETRLFGRSAVSGSGTATVSVGVTDVPHLTLVGLTVHDFVFYLSANVTVDASAVTVLDGSTYYDVRPRIVQVA